MSTKPANEVYSGEFFSGQAAGSARSAAVVVPRLLSLLQVRSVIDVGCGIGTWAAAFLANGIPDVLGVDGDYVDRSQLRIPKENFAARDLQKPIRLDKTFDLAVCLEVAEHLPESRASGLVDDLATLAPAVLFSAALPGQGGTHHLNEQYLSYWADFFSKHNFEGIDPIRPWIAGNASVEWFYQQNIVMFVAPKHPLLDGGFPGAHSLIHPRLYDLARKLELTTPRTLFRALPGALRRSIRYHLGPKGKKFD
jgi:SAM-dependent methyltransferase